mgnify:CR=1 FL=1
MGVGLGGQKHSSQWQPSGVKETIKNAVAQLGVLRFANANKRSHSELSQSTL